MSQIARQPCPYRILDDVGGAFGFGAILGTGIYFYKGFRNTPSGGKLIGALNNVRKRVPLYGSSFASWGFLYSSCDCLLTAVRHKEDIYNSLISGGAAGGILAIRAGFRAMMFNVAMGTCVIGMIEGFMIGIDRFIQKRYSDMMLKASFGTFRPMEPPPVTMRLDDLA